MQTTRPGHRVETTIQEDGTLTLDHLPFQAGESVEVIILPYRVQTTGQARYPLRGSKVHYDRPLESVSEEEWRAAR